jgi:hypothetical protein
VLFRNNMLSPAFPQGDNRLPDNLPVIHSIDAVSATPWRRVHCRKCNRM